MRLIAALLAFILCGCSAAQVRQEFVGYSINDVRNSKSKQIRTFDMSAPDCISKIKEILEGMKAVTREDAGNQYLLVDNFQEAFRSSINTTQVGILIVSETDIKSRVEIASGNVDLAAFVAGKITDKINLKQEPLDK